MNALVESTKSAGLVAVDRLTLPYAAVVIITAVLAQRSTGTATRSSNKVVGGAMWRSMGAIVVGAVVAAVTNVVGGGCHVLCLLSALGSMWGYNAMTTHDFAAAPFGIVFILEFAMLAIGGTGAILSAGVLRPVGYGLLAALLLTKTFGDAMGGCWVKFAAVATAGLTALAHVEQTPSNLHLVVLGATPALLYLVSGPAEVASGVAVVLRPVAGAAVLAASVAYFTTWSGVYCFAAVLAVALAILLRFYGQRAAVLRPEGKRARRGQVLLVVAFALAAFDIAAGETAERGLPWDSATILALALSFGAVVALVCTLLALVAVWEPYTAQSNRLMMVDLLTAAVILSVGVVTVFTQSPDVPIAMSWVKNFVTPFLPLELVEAVAGVSPMTMWGAAWTQAVVAVTLFSLGVVTWATAGGSNALLAPYVAMVSTQGAFVRPRAALTFNGLPEHDDDVQELLAALEETGSNATFFLSAEDVSRAEALQMVVNGDHEVGVLGGERCTVAEMDGVVGALKKAEVASPQWFRPADGDRHPDLLQAANAMGLSVALWNVTGGSACASAGELTDKVAAQAGRGGDIVAVPALGRVSAGAAARAVAEVYSGRGQVLTTLSAVCPNGGRGTEALDSYYYGKPKSD